MFTGLIKDCGKIISVTENQEGILFEVETKLAADIAIDDSVAVNGVCLTAIAVFERRFQVQAVHLTLEKSNLHYLKKDSLVNLELALKYSDRLGGHLVLGHVNGVAKVTELTNRGDNFKLWFELPEELIKFVVREGSIAIDGISLTIADVSQNKIMVTIIPHTWKETQMQHLKIGSIVNIEVDSNAVMMAKYLDTLFAKYMKDKGL